MKTRKFLSIFVVLSLILAYMIPFAGAAELFENTVTWTFTDAPAGTMLTNSSGKDKEWYIDTTDLSNGLIAYAESSIDSSKQEYNRAFEIERTSKAVFGDEEVMGVLKFGGKSTSTARYLTYTPAADGVLTAYVKHGSPSKDNTDIRRLVVEQDGTTTTVDTIGTDNPNVKGDINVKGGIEVKISADNNVGLSKLVFTPGGAAEEPSDTEPPAEATDDPSSPTADPSATTMPVTKSVWYAKEADGEAIDPSANNNNTAKVPAGKNLAEGTDIAVYVMEDMLYKNVKASFVDTEGNPVDAAAEMIGRITKSSTNPSKNDFGKSGASMKVVPSKNGTLSAYVKVSASETKLFYINDADGNVVAEYKNSSGGSIYVRVDAAVEANKEYYAYTDGAGTDFFGFEFTPSESSSATAQPAETTAPTGDPSSTTAPAAKSVWYAKEADGEAIDPGANNNNTAKVPAGKNLAQGTDIAVYVMEDMLYKNVKASFVDTEGNPVNAAAEMIGRITKSSTNPSKKDFGKSGASMKVVPSKNGTLSAYVKVSSAKVFCINDADGSIVAEYTNESGGSIYVRVDAAVEAGKEYYAYTDGAGTDFFGFEFTPAGSSETTTPTTKPSETTAPTTTNAPSVGSDLTAVTESKSWTFDDYVGANVTSAVIIGEGKDLKIYGYEKMAVDKNSKTVGDVKYESRLKMAGVGIFDNLTGVPTGRVMEILPGKSGTLKVAFAHASTSGDPRTLAVTQNGVERGSMTVAAGEANLFTCTVAANAPVYIYGKDGGLNFYGVIFEASEAAEPTATPTADPSATANPSATTAPTTPTDTPVPTDPDTQKAQADADALTLRSISDYAIYIDLDLAKSGANGSTITWESSNEKYISIQTVTSNASTYTGVVTRPTTDAECDESGGVPVTLTATVQYADSVVRRTFDVSVRKFDPIYYNDFQADVGVEPDGNYKGIQDNVKAANGDTFRGIRVASLDNTKSMYGFEHEDHDVESYFDKRIMSTDSVTYGDKVLVPTNDKDKALPKPVAPDGTVPEENFAFYYQHYNPYDGGTTYIPLWIRLEDKDNTSGYPEGLVIVSMDIYVIDGRQKFNIGIGTSKPAQECRFLLNNGDQTSAGYPGGGVLRCFDEGNNWDYLDKSKYTIPKGKWITATIVANSTTHLWDFYFDGMQIRKGLKFRNAEDFIATIEFTMDRNPSYKNGKYLIDNISVENITDDYNETYWDNLELEAPYSTEREAYVVSSPFRLFYNGTDGLAGQVYSWKSSNPNLLKAGSKSVAVADLGQYGFTEAEIKKYKDKGVKYVTIAVAEPVTENIPEEGAYVTLKGSMEIGEKIYSKEFKIFVTKSVADAFTDSEKALADLNAITVVKNGMTISTSKDIDLPKLGSLYSSSITWKSSNSKIIDEFGNVTLPSSTTQVTLTATAVNGTATETKKFTFYVKGKSSSTSGGGGGGGGGGSYSGLGSVSRVVGTVSTPTEKFETDAYTPEQTSKLIFNDIENITWAKDAIEALYNKGVVSGFGNGFFAPNNSVTREQFVKMLVSALELDTNITSDISFTDVNGDEWYAPYINAAAVLGVVTGKDDGSFGIGESITRQDMAVMCVRALTVSGRALADSEAAFNDNANISDYAKAAVGSMAGAGYLTGDENGSFNPLDTATRAQTAVVLYRIITN